MRPKKTAFNFLCRETYISLKHRHQSSCGIHSHGIPRLKILGLFEALYIAQTKRANVLISQAERSGPHCNSYGPVGEQSNDNDFLLDLIETVLMRQCQIQGN